MSGLALRTLTTLTEASLTALALTTLTALTGLSSLTLTLSPLSALACLPLRTLAALACLSALALTATSSLALTALTGLTCRTLTALIGLSLRRIISGCFARDAFLRLDHFLDRAIFVEEEFIDADRTAEALASLTVAVQRTVMVEASPFSFSGKV